MTAYLATLKPGFPHTIDEMIERAERYNAPGGNDAGPNPSRWSLFKREAAAGTLDDYRYQAVHDQALPMVRTVVDGILAAQRLDAIVYPTSSRRPSPIASAPDAAPATTAPSATNIANLTGYPDLIVPAGFTGDRLPVGLSFFGPAFSEPRLLALGFSFEQATHARRRPVHAPLLPGQIITVPPGASR